MLDETKVLETAILSPEKQKDDTPLFDFRAKLTQKSNKRYKFIRSIGFGGMKAVLLVLDNDTGREVAMAMIPDFRDRSDSDIARFTYEARLTAKLEHPNIVPVHDMGLDLTGAPFFTMKYLRGKSLATLLRQVRRDDPGSKEEYALDRAIQIFVRVCNAVIFAHSQRIVHLDIKPDNINIGDFGEVLVLDWGLGFYLDERKRHLGRSENKNSATGTPGFMSPEQAGGHIHEIDEQSDVYALGSLLYAMLTLQSPLAGKPVEEILARTQLGDIPPPSEVANSGLFVPPSLEAICKKAMSVNKEDRYASVKSLRDDVQAFSKGYASTAENATVLRKASLFVGRHLVETVMAIIIVVLLTALVYLLYFN